MDVNEFRKDFLEEIKSTAAITGDGSAATFMNIATEYLIGAEVLPDFTNIFYSGTGAKKRSIKIDGYVLDEFDYTLTLFIADYSGLEDREVLTKTKAQQFFDKLHNFVDEVYNYKLVKKIEPSTPVADLIELMKFNENRIRKYRFILITDGNMSGRITTLDSQSFNDIPIECQIWDVERLFKMCSSDIARQNIEIDFKAYTKTGIPCLEASNANTSDYKSFLCIIPGEALANIYDNYGSQLLEGNVRSFLSTKVAVNKKIRETIIKVPELFFAYNNGISATANDITIEKRPDGNFITYAKDFQIINGGQTTASLSNTRHKDKAKLNTIYVQMKLTKVDSNPEKSSDLVRNISRSSNSQSKVSDADFFSTHPFHIRMEQISRRLFAPAVGGAQFETKWFYERARGQYLQEQMRLSKVEKDKFALQLPKKQLVTKTDLAKVRNSWNGIPHVVSKGAQTNFMKFAECVDEEWINSDTKFNEKYYRESIALLLLFKHTEKLVTNQPWYENGYRANIVAYSMALLRKQISKQFKNRELDLQLIWNKQSVPNVVTNELVKITKEVYKSITDPTRETINVTQWCKRETCWTRIQNIKIDLHENLVDALIERQENSAQEKEAKKDQKFMNGYEAQIKVISYKPEFWTDLNKFVVQKKMASPEILRLLKIAMRLPNSLPDETQSVKLLELLEKALSEGYKIDTYEN